VSPPRVRRDLVDGVGPRRGQTVRPDDEIERMIARTSARLRPDTAYRWRLRGHVLNHYVAAQDGLIGEIPMRREMGRLGRSVLYASLGVAISVSVVGAASSSALPGDPLYMVKLQVEELRLAVAPSSVRPALAAMAVDERISEIERLAARGDWQRLALAEAEVEAAVSALRSYGGPIPAAEIAELARNAKVLSDLLATAPPSPLQGLRRALAVSAAVGNPGDASQSSLKNGVGLGNQVSQGVPGLNSRQAGQHKDQASGTTADAHGSKPTSHPAAAAQPSAPAATIAPPSKASPHPNPSPHPQSNGGTSHGGKAPIPRS
jgi:hypothetical protein